MPLASRVQLREMTCGTDRGDAFRMRRDYDVCAMMTVDRWVGRAVRLLGLVLAGAILIFSFG